MDFGEILGRWEKGRPPRGGREQPGVDMEAALERFPPDARARAGRQEEPAQARRPAAGRAAARLAPQAELDLHGLSGAQALQALEAFVRDARARGLGKVLLIHGKGNHSPGEPVLERVVRGFLEGCPHTGAFGKAERARGGRGATWVLIRPR